MNLPFDGGWKYGGAVPLWTNVADPRRVHALRLRAELAFLGLDLRRYSDDQERDDHGRFGSGGGGGSGGSRSTSIEASSGDIDLAVDSEGTLTLNFTNASGYPDEAYLHGSEDIASLASSVDRLSGHTPDPEKSADAMVGGSTVATEGGEGYDVDVTLYNSGVIRVTFDAREATETALDLDPTDQAPFVSALREMTR